MREVTPPLVCMVTRLPVSFLSWPRVHLTRMEDSSPRGVHVLLVVVVTVVMLLLLEVVVVVAVMVVGMCGGEDLRLYCYHNSSANKHIFTITHCLLFKAAPRL